MSETYKINDEILNDVKDNIQNNCTDGTVKLKNISKFLNSCISDDKYDKYLNYTMYWSDREDKPGHKLYGIVINSDIEMNIPSYKFYRSPIYSLKLSNCKTIKEYAFALCWYFHYLKLNNVERIENYAFYDDVNLECVSLPDSIEYIGANAFSVESNNTGGISEIFIPSTCETIEAFLVSKSPFYNTNVEIYTDAESRPSGWSLYFNYLKAFTKATVHYGVSREDFESTPTYTEANSNDKFTPEVLETENN